jgi:hypothetical protein
MKQCVEKNSISFWLQEFETIGADWNQPSSSLAQDRDGDRLPDIKPRAIDRVSVHVFKSDGCSLNRTADFI